MQKVSVILNSRDVNDSCTEEANEELNFLH